ncbi:MAG: recombinase family protein [Clostridia bacterium]|nr:recombinase family protein [Clostridia bacterium]
MHILVSGKGGGYTQKLFHFAIYSRKSRFTGTGESIGNQIELCRNYIRLHYGDAEADSALLYEDEGYSGKNTDRPQFRRMMRDAMSGKIDAVVVYRLDRVSRNIGDFAALIEKLNDKRVAFLSVREQFETASPMGRAMMYIASVFSQLERETIAERIRDNLHELAKTGRWLGGITPLGYRSQTVEYPDEQGKTHRRCLLQTVPAEMETVRQIFRWARETGSAAKTAELLNEQRYRTRRGEPFSPLAVRSILSNPVYMKADEEAYRYFTDNGCVIRMEKERFDGTHGMMIYNRTEQKKGKAHRIRPVQEWIGAVGEHEGILDAQDWIQIQRILHPPSAKRKSTTKNSALLSEMLYCGCCGAPMRVKLRGEKEQSERPFYYLCTAKEKSHGTQCSVHNADGNALDSLILAEMLRRSGEKPQTAETLTQEEKRELLQTAIRRVVWDGEKAEVIWHGEQEAEEPACIGEKSVL